MVVRVEPEWPISDRASRKETKSETGKSEGGSKRKLFSKGCHSPEDKKKDEWIAS